MINHYFKKINWWLRIYIQFIGKYARAGSATQQFSVFFSLWNCIAEPDYNSKTRPGEAREPEWLSIEIKIRLDSLLNAQPIYKWFNETKLTKVGHKFFL